MESLCPPSHVRFPLYIYWFTMFCIIICRSKSINSVKSVKMVRLSVFMVLAFLCSSTTAIEAAEHPKYKDPKQPLHVRIKDLMSRMTLEEKIGQMTMIELNVTSPEVIRKYHIGKYFSKILIY